MGFRGDERGQSEVIGALLIFAVIVAFIGLNQAVLVPQANEEIEFKHNNDVQRDIVDLRAATTEAAASNQPRARTIQLGTDYPSRFVAINPPPATGTIQTVDGEGDITETHDDLDLSAICGTNGQPDTKFIEYQPKYNEYGNALPMTIENTVVYRDAGSSKLYSTGQVFTKGNQINIIRYVGDVQESKSGSVSLDLIPSETGATTVSTSNDGLYLTMPTRLTVSDWKDLIDTSKVTPEPASGKRVNFSFQDNTEFTVRCTTVGINEEPDVNPINYDDTNSENRFNSINPATQGNIILESVSSTATTSGPDDYANVSITLRNESSASDTVTIDRARLNYYSGTSPGRSPENGITHMVFTDSGDRKFEVGEDAKPLQSPVALNDDTTTVRLGFDGEVENDDFYVLTLEFSDGNVDTYFISHTS